MKKGSLNNIGKIIKLSGHSGELIISGASIPEQIKDFTKPVFIEMENEWVPFYIHHLTPINKEKSVISFEYVTTERKALRLQNKDVYTETKGKKRVDDVEDFSGYRVRDVNRGDIGILKFIDEKSNNPLMIIEKGNLEILIPFQEEFIAGVDIKKKILKVNCPKGLLELYLPRDEEE